MSILQAIQLIGLLAKSNKRNTRGRVSSSSKLWIHTMKQIHTLTIPDFSWVQFLTWQLVPIWKCVMYYVRGQDSHDTIKLFLEENHSYLCLILSLIILWTRKSLWQVQIKFLWFAGRILKLGVIFDHLFCICLEWRAIFSLKTSLEDLGDIRAWKLKFNVHTQIGLWMTT